MLPTILDASAVESLLSKIDVVSVLKDMFIELAQDSAVQPAQTLTLLPNGIGDFITYQGALGLKGVFGAKLSPYIVTQDQPIITAWTCLMSMTTGAPLLLCDSSRLTTERTAGTTALAVDALAKSNSRKVAIIGSGQVAQAHWRHVKGLRDWSDIIVWSPSLSENSDRLKQWNEICPNFKLAESAHKAVENADVVMLCTSSGKPVIDPASLLCDALVTSISTNVAQAHEIPPEALAGFEVYCDYRQTTPHTAGEMILAIRDHHWSADRIIGDLAELVTGKCPAAQSDKPVFFRSVGLGLEDIAIASAINDVLPKNQNNRETS